MAPITITIDKNTHNQRFDRFLRKYLKDQTQITLADIYRGIRNRLVLVNDKKANEEYRLCDKDVITIKEEFTNKPLDTKKPQARRIAPISVADVRALILFEDKNWLVFNKPTGISIHPSDNENKQRSMHDLLRAYIPATAETFNPAFGYRLDKETSGVLIAGKTYDSLQYINQIIRDRQIKKEYLAVVVGKFPKHLHIDKPLRKGFDSRFNRGKTVITESSDEDAKESVTECRLQKVYDHPLLGQISLVKVHIETGRMHQIRVHLADAGYPVLGDILYGHPRVNRVLLEKVKIKNLFLHCWKYSFFDLFSESTVSFESPIPKHFDQVLG